MKPLVSFSNDYIGLTYGFLNMIPPGVAFFTTGAHCYVYYHLFQLRATKNIDRTLEYTMGKLSTYVVILLHRLRILEVICGLHLGGKLEKAMLQKHPARNIQILSRRRRRFKEQINKPLNWIQLKWITPTQTQWWHQWQVVLFQRIKFQKFLIGESRNLKI